MAIDILKQTLLGLTFAAFLTACGGGGGSETPAGEAPSPAGAETGGAAGPIDPGSDAGVAGAGAGGADAGAAGAGGAGETATGSTPAACRAPPYPSVGTPGSYYALVFKGCDASNNPVYYDKSECAFNYITRQYWEGTPEFGKPNGERFGVNSSTNYDNPLENQYPDGHGGYRRPTIAEINALGNTGGYIKEVNRIKLCGFDNWRLPTLSELLNVTPMNIYYFPHYSVGSTVFTSYANWTQRIGSPSYNGTSLTNERAVTYDEKRSERLLVRLIRD